MLESVLRDRGDDAGFAAPRRPTLKFVSKTGERNFDPQLCWLWSRAAARWLARQRPHRRQLRDQFRRGFRTFLYRWRWRVRDRVDRDDRQRSRGQGTRSRRREHVRIRRQGGLLAASSDFHALSFAGNDFWLRPGV